MQVTVTPKALIHIQGILSSQGEGFVFRLALKKSGCSGYRYDPQVVLKPDESDHEMRLEDGSSMYVQQGTDAYFDGLILDVIEKNLGTQMVFINPNADDECGCGESFNLKTDSSDKEA